MLSTLPRTLPGVLAGTLLLAGCVTLGNSGRPIASIVVPAPKPGAERVLLVVLPGFGVGAESLLERGVAELVHEQWPHVDVLMASATFAYYRRNNLVDRLDEDVLAPARRDGYDQVWLAGASIGGAGALFYEHQHPGRVDGLILLAPWLGFPRIRSEIRDAGGLPRWDPGPRPATVDNDNFQRELWRVAKRWSQDPEAARRVWLVCGRRDMNRESSALLATALPAEHVVQVDGGHQWETFQLATRQIMARMREHGATIAAPAGPVPGQVSGTSSNSASGGLSEG